MCIRDRYSALTINFSDLLSNLQKNYKSENKGPIFSMFKNTHNLEENKNGSLQSPKKLDNLLNFTEAQKNRSNSLWPFPLLSLVHAFGIDLEVDRDLGREFLSLIHISEPTRPLYISYAVFCLKKKKKQK
eukprot:TRINITY_DN26095_c0_g1_i1.p1 TRINITY_DN26095_c0_g1~~TRINITY_DN26095_c0_g1_i1.p1  ORF type:complete len:130 (-),score=35.95 TRINITY_DN26095_c0_g1_i1:3-392(-)